MINLETKEKTIKVRLFDKAIEFIKVHERNKCVIVATFGFEKVCLVDYQGNKLTNNPVHPFSLIVSNETKLKILN